MRSSKPHLKTVALMAFLLLCRNSSVSVAFALCFVKQRQPIGAGEYVLSDTTSDAELEFGTCVQFREREENSGFALEEASFRHHAIRAAWVEFSLHSRH